MSEEIALRDPGRGGRLEAMAGYALVPLLCAVATLAAVFARRFAPAPSLTLIYVLPVVILAARFGWGPALASAAVGALAFNFFLTEPRYTLRVDDPGNVWALVLLTATAAIVSAVGAEARRRAVQARTHADQADALQALARALVAAPDQHAIAEATAHAVARLFDAPSLVLIAEGASLSATTSTSEALGPDDLDAARWALGAGQATRAGAYPVDRSTFDLWPFRTRSPLRAVIGLALPESGRGRPADTDRAIESVGGYLAVALERDRYALQALEGRLSMESERVKSDLLAAVSHDLRTPLSTILVSLQSLRRFGDAHDDEDRRQLLHVAEAETARLSGLVGNLLQMSRIDADAVAVQPSESSAADLVAGAVERAADALGPHVLSNQVGVSAPLIRADLALAETAMAAVLENAGKYAPPGSTVTVTSQAIDGVCEMQVLDEGPGFPADAEPLFAKFTRGVDGDGRPPGTGLGLAIARGFLQAQGGSIHASNRTDRPGGRVIIRLPLAAMEHTRP